MSSGANIDDLKDSRQKSEYSSCGHSVFEQATFSRNVLDAISDGQVSRAHQGLHNAHHYAWLGSAKLLDKVPDLNQAIISSTRALNGNADFGGLGALQLRLRNLDLLQARPESANTSMDAVIEFWSAAREFRNDRFLGEVAANVCLVCRKIDALERVKNPQAGSPNATEFLEYVLGTEQEFLSQRSPSVLRFWLAATCHATYFHQFAEVDPEVQKTGKPLYDSMIRCGSTGEVDLALRSIDSFVVYIQKNPSLKSDFLSTTRSFLQSIQSLLRTENKQVGTLELRTLCQYNDRAGIEVASESIKSRAERLEKVLFKLAS